MRTSKQTISLGGRFGGSERMSADFLDNDYRQRSGATALHGPYFGHRDRAGDKVLASFQAVIRLIFPVVSLLVVFFALAICFDTVVPMFPDAGGRFWLTESHMVLPLAFFVLHLTNRRYGPAYAFAQLTVSLALIIGAILFARAEIEALVRPEMLPTMRESVAFAAALFVSGFLSIVAFDGARGPAWWTAPLSGFLVAAIFFPLVFFPAAYAGLDMPWIAFGMTYLGILLGEGVLCLLPYMLLRPVVQPLSGFGGY